MPDQPTKAVKHEKADEIAAELRNEYSPSTPTGPTADTYRIAGYQQNLIGNSKTPGCLIIAAKWDSGLKWPDPNNPQPTDLLWNGGVTAGVWWDGTFYRDLTRYSAGGPLHWCSYFKPGSGPGNKNGYWINFGCAYSHLANDDPAQLLTGAAQRLFWEAGVVAPVPGASAGAAGTAAATPGQWKLLIQATDYVTAEVRDVWHGVKAGGHDPTGVYTRIAGCDPAATLSVDAL